MGMGIAEAVAFQTLQREFEEFKAKVLSHEGRLNEHHGTLSYLKGLLKKALGKKIEEPAGDGNDQQVQS